MNPYLNDPEREARIRLLIRLLAQALDATIRQSREIARLSELLQAEGVATSFHFGTVGAEGMVDLTIEPWTGGFAAAPAELDHDWTPEDREFLKKLGKSLS